MKIKPSIINEYPFNPIERAKEIEPMVMEGLSRRYYRFRWEQKWWAPSVCDSSGCCLNCAYCWNATRNLEIPGAFQTPRYVASKLIYMSDLNRDKRHPYNMRTGGCDILGKQSMRHLIEIIKEVESKCKGFLVETNGIMLGYYPELLEMLEPFNNIVKVRISAKGHDPDIFEKISGAESSFFRYPKVALKLADKKGFETELAWMPDFCDGKILCENYNWNGATDQEALKIYPNTVQQCVKRNVWDMRRNIKESHHNNNLPGLMIRNKRGR